MRVMCPSPKEWPRGEERGCPAFDIKTYMARSGPEHAASACAKPGHLSTRCLHWLLHNPPRAVHHSRPHATALRSPAAINGNRLALPGPLGHRFRQRTCTTSAGGPVTGIAASRVPTCRASTCRCAIGGGRGFGGGDKAPARLPPGQPICCQAHPPQLLRLHSGRIEL